MSFETLELHASLLRAIEACRFTAPTEIQQQAIPLALAGRDVMASAQTGTGKTAAFVLPALQRLLTEAPRSGRGPRVLVLTPTRELAQQVTDNIAQFSKFCRLSSGSIVGGLPYPKQIKLLQQPLDLLVATPGRLMDHMERGRVDFGRLELLVLDEADRMLDMGFIDAVKTIAAALPAERQTLLFSATLEGRVLDVAKRLLKDPARIQLAVATRSHDSITQMLHDADDATHKHALLSHWLKQHGMYQAVVFTNTKRGAAKLAKRLESEGHTSAALHGDMNQNQRRRTVEQMRRGKVQVLVATDVAARGLDIQGISHVVNYDLPMVAEDYIHRIGRTGRGGATGVAITLLGADDRGKWRDIERLTKTQLTRSVIEGLEPTRPTHAARPHGDRRPRPAVAKARAYRNGEHPRRSEAPFGNARAGRPARGSAEQRPGQRPAQRAEHAPRKSNAGHAGGARRDESRGQRRNRPQGQRPQPFIG